MAVALAFALAALAAVGTGLGIRVVVAGYSPVPFADFWGQFPFLERAVDHDLRLADFWAQANEHRIFIPRIQFVLDYALFGGTNVFLFTVIVVSCLVTAAALAAVVWFETRDRLVSWCTLCVASIAMMSPAAWENLTWAFQVGFVQVFLFAALAIIACVLGARAPRHRTGWIVMAILCAIGASYSLANGLIVWLVLVLVALVVRLERRSSVLIAAAAALTVLSYLWHFEYTTHGNVAHPLGMLRYVAIFLGSTVAEVGIGFAEAVGYVGLALAVALLLLAWRDRAHPGPMRLVGAGIALFVVLSAAETAAGRLQLGLAQASSSRYATASLFFWLALAIGYLRSVLVRAVRRPWLPAAYLSVGAVAACAVAVSALPSRASLRSTVSGKEITVVAYRVGVDDPSGTITGVPPSPAIASALRWMEQHELGPWAPGGMVDEMRFDLRSGADTTMCRGGVESVEPIGGGRRLRGWLAPPGRERASRNLAVLDATGRPAGAGRVGTYRPDVKESGAASSEWTGFTAYVRDGGTAPFTVVLVGRDDAGAVCRLEVPSGG